MQRISQKTVLIGLYVVGLPLVVWSLWQFATWNPESNMGRENELIARCESMYGTHARNHGITCYRDGVVLFVEKF